MSLFGVNITEACHCARSQRLCAFQSHNSMKVQFDFAIHDTPKAFYQTVGFVIGLTLSLDVF